MTRTLALAVLLTSGLLPARRASAQGAQGAELANPRPSFLAHVAVDRADGVYREGQTLAVRFASERDAYLYLLYHQADGRCLLLFPNPARPDARVPGRREVRVPAPEDAARFRFRVGPPFGDETLQVLATTRPLDPLDRLTGTRRPPVVAPEALAALRADLAGRPEPWAEHRVPIRTRPLSDRDPARPPARLGLFVGIGRYLHPEFAPTHEELRHSAEVMHDRMLRHGGLDPSRTKLVVDREATRANLEALLTRWLPGASRPGDTVVLYFSGHAGQTPNRDGTEADGQDEMLGPYDLDAGPPDLPRAAREARFRDTSVTDDVLARWLESLSGRQVILILDTCHGGGVVAGKSPARLFEDEVARVKDISGLNIVVLASCAADEQSLFEGTPGQTMWFTHFLAEAVATLPRPLTVRSAFDYVREGLRKVLERRREAREQEPVLWDPSPIPSVLVP